MDLGAGWAGEGVLGEGAGGAAIAFAGGVECGGGGWCCCVLLGLEGGCGVMCGEGEDDCCCYQPHCYIIHFIIVLLCAIEYDYFFCVIQLSDVF